MQTRALELYLSTVMLALGAALLFEGDSLLLPQYAYLWPALNEDAVGYAMLLIGAIRWSAVTINGFWRPSPLLRLLGCIIGSFVWMLLLVSLLSSSVPGVPPGVAWYGTAFLFEVYATARATTDAVTMGSFRCLRRRHVGRV